VSRLSHPDAAEKYPPVHARRAAPAALSLPGAPKIPGPTVYLCRKMAHVRLRLRLDGPRPDRPLGPGGHPGPSVGAEGTAVHTVTGPADAPGAAEGTAVRTVTGPASDSARHADGNRGAHCHRPAQTCRPARARRATRRDGAGVACTRGQAHSARAKAGSRAGQVCNVLRRVPEQRGRGRDGASVTCTRGQAHIVRAGTGILRATRPGTLAGTAVHTVTGPTTRASLRVRGGPCCAVALV